MTSGDATSRSEDTRFIWVKYIEGAKSPLPMEFSNKTFVGRLIEVTLEKGHIDVSPFNVETSGDGTPVSMKRWVT